VAGLDGSPMLRATAVVGDDIVASAQLLAAELEAGGASTILAEARAVGAASREAPTAS
jgi:hypothetical protein